MGCKDSADSFPLLDTYSELQQTLRYHSLQLLNWRLTAPWFAATNMPHLCCWKAAIPGAGTQHKRKSKRINDSVGSSAVWLTHSHSITTFKEQVLRKVCETRSPLSQMFFYSCEDRRNRLEPKEVMGYFIFSNKLITIGLKTFSTIYKRTAK